MSLWSRFLDWILGVEVISMDDLKAIEDSSIERLKEEFAAINSTIDTDADGMVSIREAWALIKSTFSTVKAVIKEVFR